MESGYGSISHVENKDNIHDSPSSWLTWKSLSHQSKIFLVVASAFGVLALPAFHSLKNQQHFSASSAKFVPYEAAEDLLGSPKQEDLLDNSLDSIPLWHDQFLDHIGHDTEHQKHPIKTYKQRFLKKSEHWLGPGHPILVIMGGEGPIDPPMLYQFVYDGLAEKFGAFVLEPEHRFYGESQPIEKPHVKDLIKYLTPDQALADAINIIQYTREELGCSSNPNSVHYCPVITFGGSYPGFLSAMLRFRYPDYVDIGYASSAPLKLYSQVVNSNKYFDKISEVAEGGSPGCALAVRSTMFAVRDELLSNYTNVEDAAHDTGFCTETFPKYVKSIKEFVSENVVYLVPAIFADFNMAYYPPGPETALERACSIFKDTTNPPIKRLSNFFDLRGEVEYGETPKCFDLSLELPAGPRSRIRGSDNSGTGGGFTGEMWEFQCCKDLIVRAGYSEQSMFIPRRFSYAWHKKHCKERFPGVPVEPFRMAMEWGINDLSQTSRILFANGLHDGWSTSSILRTDNPNLAVLNFPNGAHHSELRRHYPDPNNTEDIKKGFQDIEGILGSWLDEIRSTMAS